MKLSLKMTTLQADIWESATTLQTDIWESGTTLQTDIWESGTTLQTDIWESATTAPNTNLPIIFVKQTSQPKSELR